VLAVDALASEVIGVLAGNGQATRPGAAIAHRTRELIDADPTRRHRLDQLAREAGCHPITLAREFRRATGSSLGTYVRRARLRRACELLRLGELPISMVAATCGFADQAHLTRALRRATGRTPARLSA
jgi:AraC family transcriptional regulator